MFIKTLFSLIVHLSAVKGRVSIPTVESTKVILRKGVGMVGGQWFSLEGIVTKANG